MKKKFVSHQSLPEFQMWKKLSKTHAIFSFDLEITARCNLNCRHCYINLPAGDPEAKREELPLNKIENIVESAASMGVMWCLLTGGEPLLREDFHDIYLMLKKKGLLISVFTNATLITATHINLFRKYPPRDIEITVYGATSETYETITRIPGSFKAFKRGLSLLENSGVKIRLKAMALRSNIHEIPGIKKFCEKKTKDYFRFDPFLHLRFDGDPHRNEEIKQRDYLLQK
jgi:MoaA/NifB/PqqE/SkfB family radical SAM enzyme